MFFHRFQRAAGMGLALQASDDCLQFWQRLVVQIGHENDAIKHAIIALSSGCQSMKLKNQGLRMLSQESGPFKSLEHLANDQCNKAIYHLRKQVMSNMPKDIEMTLICCLILIALESALGRKDVLMMHLLSGSRIVETMVPDELFVYAFGDEADPASKACQRTCEKRGFDFGRISRSEWRQLLTLFMELEFSHLLYSPVNSNVKPSICLRLNKMAPVEYTGIGGSGLKTVKEVRYNVGGWTTHAFATLYDTIAYKGDAVYWNQPEHQKLLKHLISRGQQSKEMFESFKALEDSMSPIEYFRMRLVHSQVHGLLTVLQSMPFNYTRREFNSVHRQQLEEMIDMLEELVQRMESLKDDLPELTIDVGLLPTVSSLMFHVCDPDLRRRVLNVAKSFRGRHEGAYQTAALLKACEGRGTRTPVDEMPDAFLDELVGPTLTGTDGIGGLQASFRLLDVKE